MQRRARVFLALTGGRQLWFCMEHDNRTGNPPPGYAKTVALRRALARGLAAWRASALDRPRYLSAPVLAAALRHVEAGFRLSEPELELVFRSALYHGLEVETALTVMPDADLAAAVVVDALVAHSALGLDMLWRLQMSGVGPLGWEIAAAERLRMEMSAVAGGDRVRIQAAIYQLETGLPVLDAVTRQRTDTTVPQPQSGQRRRALLLVVLAAVVALGIFRQWANSQETGQAMWVGLPEGAYPLPSSNSPGNHPLVDMIAFEMAVHEVTNREYRACVNASGCEPPFSPHSMTRANYYLDPRYDEHPVVNVTLLDAQTFCEHIGGRLPTAEEWTVAASYSALTNRQYDYPWGDRFDFRFANSLESGIGDTVPVTAYHPQGDSPLGLRNMAGNVAEWTASGPELDHPGAAEGLAVVKGGSFLDAAEELRAAAQKYVPAGAAYPWIGFRCAR